MRIESEVKLDFSDVLIRPKRSSLKSRADVVITRTFSFLHSPKVWSGVPLFAANMDATGTFSIARALAPFGMVTALHKYYSIQELTEFFLEFREPSRVAYTLGIRDEDFSKLSQIKQLGLDSYFDFIVLDVPNGYLDRFLDAIQYVRREFPNHIIIAGNVVTNEMTEAILKAGADVVKIGIGSGAACTTRVKAGVGYPQLSAVIECADAAHGIGNGPGRCGLVMSDGGATNPGDVSKAFCAGADFVMSGSLFAGYDQSGGAVVEKDGKMYKQYLGSSSRQALEKYYGSVAVHRASEGRNLLIPYRGEISVFIQDLFGGLRSTGTYIGATTLKEFSKRATFILVNHHHNLSLAQFDQNN